MKKKLLSLVLCFSMLAFIQSGYMDAFAPEQRPDVSPPHTKA